MRKLLAACAAVLSLSAPAIAFADKPPKDQVPEIDVGSAAKGIALLIAGLLVVGEGLRRRR
jgi:hypothetical protein